MARRQIVIDARTEDMPDQVLECRGRHVWVRIPQTQNYRKRLLDQQGIIEIVKRCECGTVWTQRYDAESWDRTYNNYDYSNAPGYTAPKGTGRLSRLDALKAQFVRENPGLFKVIVE